MSVVPEARRIEPDFRAKIWGSPRIGPWFEPRNDSGELVGEVWFPAGDLLIKFLFTSKNLSVQVHPNDDYGRIHENSRGKTEMWHILRADPGARIAVGFKQPISQYELIPAAETGRIMDLLNWIEVAPGETYFIPAGTVHAIGAGLALCEIQQNSDVTYRLYDYGRNRPLHLKQAAAVSHLCRHPGKSVPLPMESDMRDGIHLLAECPYFRTYSAVVNLPEKLTLPSGSRFMIFVEGTGMLNGVPVSAGQVFDVSQAHDWLMEPDRLTLPGYVKILITG